jgi:hypothetical protein
MFSIISVYNGYAIKYGLTDGKKPRAGACMGKNLYPHAGMGFLLVELELAGAGMEWHYPTDFYPLPSLRRRHLRER